MGTQSMRQVLVLIAVSTFVSLGYSGQGAGGASDGELMVEDMTTRVSVASDGTEANGASYCERFCISVDGRFVTFWSRASNLVPDDTNGVEDVFVHDCWLHETARLSVASDGSEGNASSGSPAISADGRYVAFSSWANNLVPDDINGMWDIFVYELGTGEISRVSVASDGTEANAGCSDPSLSVDGRYVAFWSSATNLGPGSLPRTRNVFVHDRPTRQTLLVSAASDGTPGNRESGHPSVSADGGYVAFSSYSTNLAPGHLSTTSRVFVHVLRTGETSLASIASDGTPGNGWSGAPAISGDGRYVSFRSVAQNLVPRDSNGRYDVFVHDRHTGQTSRVSIASDGKQGNGDCFGSAISADGRYVAFASKASNLVADDTNGKDDVFVHDRHTGQTIRVSIASDGEESSGYSFAPSISPNGMFVAFSSDASNLVVGDTNGTSDIFVHDRGLVVGPVSYFPLLMFSRTNSLENSNGSRHIAGKPLAEWVGEDTYGKP